MAWFSVLIERERAQREPRRRLNKAVEGNQSCAVYSGGMLTLKVNYYANLSHRPPLMSPSSSRSLLTSLHSADSDRQEQQDKQTSCTCPRRPLHLHLHPRLLFHFPRPSVPPACHLFTSSASLTALIHSPREQYSEQCVYTRMNELVTVLFITPSLRST